MRRVMCEVCGYRIEPGYLERHHVVPTDITEQAGLTESQTLSLCTNCHREVRTWYSGKVSDMAYDLKTKRFKDKSCLEMVREYQATFDGFVKYKKKQMNSAKR